jgi:hypothetical protein
LLGYPMYNAAEYYVPSYLVGYTSPKFRLFFTHTGLRVWVGCGHARETFPQDCPHPNPLPHAGEGEMRVLRDGFGTNP